MVTARNQNRSPCMETQESERMSTLFIKTRIRTHLKSCRLWKLAPNSMVDLNVDTSVDSAKSPTSVNQNSMVD